MSKLSFTAAIDTMEHIDCSTKSLDSYGERIISILEQQKRSKAWLAGQIGISKQSINYVMNHSRRPKFVSEIASALHINPEWLKTGSGEISLPEKINRHHLNYIPIVRLTDFPLPPKIQKPPELCVMADGNLPEGCFAIQLDGKSMEPLFKMGSILIFDPHLNPKTGNFIIFTLVKSNDTLFRQLLIDGKDTYLKAADPMYRVISNENLVIHGVLVESRYCFK